jgi:hypothetical protein
MTQNGACSDSVLCYSPNPDDGRSRSKRVVVRGSVYETESKHYALVTLPFYPQKSTLNFVDKWRSLSRYSSLGAKGHGVKHESFIKCNNLIVETFYVFRPLQAATRRQSRRAIQR